VAVGSGVGEGCGVGEGGVALGGCTVELGAAGAANVSCAGGAGEGGAAAGVQPPINKAALKRTRKVRVHFFIFFTSLFYSLAP